MGSTRPHWSHLYQPAGGDLVKPTSNDFAAILASIESGFDTSESRIYASPTIVKTNDVRMSQATPDNGIFLDMKRDLQGNVTIGTDYDGAQVIPRLRREPGGAYESVVAAEYLRGTVDASGNLAEDVYDPDGQKPLWVLKAQWSRLVAAIGDPGGGTTSWPIDAFIVTGQSNSTARTNTPAKGREVTDRVLTWDGATIAPLGDPTSVWLGSAFADEYVARNPGRRVLLIPSGAGSSGFTTTSLTTPPAGYYTAGGGTWDRTLAADPVNYYTRMINTTKAGMAAAIATGATVTLAGMLWSQGEADFSLSDSYATKLDDLINQTRIDLATYGTNTAGNLLPVIVGSQTPEYTTSTGNTAGVGRALAATPVRKPRTAFVWGPASSYEPSASMIHWDARGQSLRGTEFAKSGLLRARSNVTTAPQQIPTGLAVTRSGNNVVLTWTPNVNRVTAYTPQVSTDGGTTWTAAAVDTTMPTRATTTVTAGTALTARVSATNEVGTSDPCQGVNA